MLKILILTINTVDSRFYPNIFWFRQTRPLLRQTDSRFYPYPIEKNSGRVFALNFRS
jgi:hypothetical protein